MTLQYMDGFESVVDNPDFAARGWIVSTGTQQYGSSVSTVPSRTGMAGRGLMLKGPYSAGSASTPFASGGATDFGMLDVGRVNNYWKTGGFALGVNATFNKGTQLQVASFTVGEIVYDGAQYYWAIVETGATLQIGYSTDLINWTVCQTQPPLPTTPMAIDVSGSGPTATVLVSRLCDSGLAPSFYYTNNMGVTWNTMAMPAPAVSTYGMRAIFTGNVNTPVVAMGVGSGGVVNLMTFASMTATPAQIGTLTTSVASSSLAFGNAKVVKGIAFFTSVSTGATTTLPQATASSWLACPVSADMTVPANWKQTGSVTGAQMIDITFFNNQWIAVGNGGIYYAPNPGTVNAPLPPTAAFATAISIGNNTCWSVATNGSICVAVGQDPVNTYIGAIWTSTDGVHWTKVNRLINTSGSVANGNCFTNVIWDGAQFVLVGGQNSNIIATSPDGLAWTPLYYPDYTESAGTATGSFLGIYTGTFNASGVYVGWTGAATQNNGFGIVPGTSNGTTRNVSGIVINGAGTVSTQAPNTLVPVSPLSHYYELIFTAVAGSTNLFTIQLAIDGVIVGSIPTNTNSGLLALASDTTGTTHMFINLPRTGNFVVIDDIYLTDFAADAAGNVGQMGVINIVPKIGNGDVQTQFTQNGTAPSHAAQVSGALSNSEGAVFSFTTGAKDIYSTQNNIPANYRVQAVQVEAFFSKYGSIGANATVGLISNGVEVDSSAVSAVTANPVYASFIQSVDPKTNAQWTIAGINAAQLAATKVT